MRVEVKFEVGEEVFYLCDGKARKGKVETRDVFVSTFTDPFTGKEINVVKTKYRVCGVWYEEPMVFPTKEALLQNILS